jgi:hypothetical protein
MEHEERAEAAESQADELAERADQVDEQIDEARGDWEAKKHDSSVPGAQKPDQEPDKRVAEREEEGEAPEDDGAA